MNEKYSQTIRKHMGWISFRLEQNNTAKNKKTGNCGTKPKASKQLLSFSY